MATAAATNAAAATIAIADVAGATVDVAAAATVNAAADAVASILSAASVANLAPLSVTSQLLWPKATTNYDSRRPQRGSL